MFEDLYYISFRNSVNCFAKKLYKLDISVINKVDYETSLGVMELKELAHIFIFYNFKLFCTI